MQTITVETFYIPKRLHFSNLNKENEGSLPYTPKAIIVFYIEPVKTKSFLPLFI